jgi:hypothetical protein
VTFCSNPASKIHLDSKTVEFIRFLFELNVCQTSQPLIRATVRRGKPHPQPCKHGQTQLALWRATRSAAEMCGVVRVTIFGCPRTPGGDHSSQGTFSFQYLDFRIRLGGILVTFCLNPALNMDPGSRAVHFFTSSV